MNRVCCVYFSPTGGTKSVALKVAAAMAEELGLTLEEFDITLRKAREQEYNFSAEDFVLIASPTYAGRIPNKMLPEFERLVKGAGSKAVIISVYGGRSNDEEDAPEGIAAEQSCPVICQGCGNLPRKLAV